MKTEFYNTKMVTKKLILFMLFIINISVFVLSPIYATIMLPNIRFSNLYQDGMVLQREPEKASIWGYGIIPEGSKALIHCNETNEGLTFMESNIFQTDDQLWKVDVGPIKGGSSCNISVAVDNINVRLNNVLFGDVWLCGGQSNMVLGMNSIYNASQEMEIAKSYRNIRFTRVNTGSNEIPDDNMDISLAHGWVQPSSKHLGTMGAVCFLYAKYIYDHIGIPLGLIDSSVNGTKIESWSPKNALDSCSIHMEQVNCEAPDYIDCNSRLYKVQF